MTYEDFKKELQKMELSRDLVKCGYISYLDEGNELHKLNSVFGYNKVVSINWYTSKSDWNNGIFHFSLTIWDRNYNDINLKEEDKYSWYSSKDNQVHEENRHDLTDEQRDKVIAYVKDWYAKKSAELAAYIERGKNDMSIEDLQNECEKVANELLKDKTTKYGNKLRAKLSVGRRQCDGKEDYTALCIEYYGNVFGEIDWHYMGGIRLYKDKFGVNQMKVFRPLCGESHGEFNWDWFKKDVLSYTS